ncbi:dentin sialophosphoprotein-like, partial [Penaeus monodon]|uniref:dentin sialophosphoprotein-like n=1 Tax=Penaeus monodon TaxID=6687 RepID=UPI0018A7976A
MAVTPFPHPSHGSPLKMFLLEATTPGPWPAHPCRAPRCPGAYSAPPILTLQPYPSLPSDANVAGDPVYDIFYPSKNPWAIARGSVCMSTVLPQGHVPMAPLLQLLACNEEVCLYPHGFCGIPCCKAGACFVAQGILSVNPVPTHSSDHEIQTMPGLLGSMAPPEWEEDLLIQKPSPGQGMLPQMCLFLIGLKSVAMLCTVLMPLVYPREVFLTVNHLHTVPSDERIGKHFLVDTSTFLSIFPAMQSDRRAANNDLQRLVAANQLLQFQRHRHKKERYRIHTQERTAHGVLTLLFFRTEEVVELVESILHVASLIKTTSAGVHQMSGLFCRHPIAVTYLSGNQATKIRSRGRDWDSCDDNKEQNQATKTKSRDRDWDSCDDDKEQNQATKTKSKSRDWDSSDDDKEQNQATKTKSKSRDWDSSDDDKEQNQATKIRSRGRDWDSCDDDKEQNQATKTKSKSRDWDSCDDNKEQNQATKTKSKSRDWDSSDDNKKQNQATKTKSRDRDWDSCDDNKEQNQATKIRSRDRDWDSCDDDKEQNQATKMRSRDRDWDSCDDDKEQNQATKTKSKSRDWDSCDDDKEQNQATKIRSRDRDWDSCDDDKEQNQATKIRSRGRDWDSCDDDKEQNQATKIRSRGRDWDSCDDDKEQNQATKIRSRGRDWDEDEEVNHTDKKNAGRTTGDKENTEYKRGEKDVSHDPMEWDSCLQDDFEQALLKCDQMMEARRLDSLADRKKKQFDNASRPTSPPVREDSRWAPVSSKNRKPKQRESKATDDPVSAARSTYKGSEPATRSPRRRG